MTKAHEPARDGDEYGRGFYEYVDDTASASASVVVALVDAITSIDSVIDVGCGTGAWLSTFRRFGATKIRGLDAERVPADLLQIAPDEFSVVDLANPQPIDDRYSVAVSLEVAEHLPPESADRFAEFLTSLAPLVLFSAAIPGQGGELHLNEQWPAYWSERFAAHGFEALDVLRSEIWNDERVSYFYRQNLMLYVRSSSLDQLQLPDGTTRLPVPPMALVHPETFESLHQRVERWQATPLSLSAHVRALPRAAVCAVKRRLGRGAP